MKTPYPHQQTALEKAEAHYQDHDRGQLIMACGTGKTFTSKLIFKKITPPQGFILYLAPSISLIAQTFHEYSDTDDKFVIICSDDKAHKKEDGATTADLPIPPTTDLDEIVAALNSDADHRVVVLCTYQSLKLLQKAQKMGVKEFDLAICDEAHRTTGIDGENYFTSINQTDYVRCKKRLYMTATPRIYTARSHIDASDDSMVLSSMDNIETYGEVFYQLDLSDAVEADLLKDYKVVIALVSEKWAARNLQTGLTKQSQVNLNEAAKIAVTHTVMKKMGLKKALGFTNTIKRSKHIAHDYASLTKHIDGSKTEADHVEGTMKTSDRGQRLKWLEDKTDTDYRLLLNAKCLAEGVDVPTLDSTVFFDARKSHVDVVQAIGRVLRKPRNAL